MSTHIPRLGAFLLLVAVGVGGCKNPTTSPEQTGTIEGQVLNDSTGAPVAGASVTTNPATSAPATGSDGRFRLENVSAGDYTVTAKKNGFETASVSVSVREDETTQATIFLPPEDDGGPSLRAEITNWFNDSTSEDSVFADVEYEVENAGQDSVAEYEVFFEIHTPNGVFQQEEGGGSLAAGESDLGEFRKFIRDEPADSVVIADVFVPSEG